MLQEVKVTLLKSAKRWKLVSAKNGEGVGELITNIIQPNEWVAILPGPAHISEILKVKTPPE